MTITREEAFAILARDLPKYERRVARILPGASQALFDGAVSFDFNTGAIDRASWVTALKAGDAAGARSRLMLWTKAGGRTLAGLTKRREAEARLIFGGDYGAGGSATAPTVPTAEVRTLQTDLATLGIYRGAIDGLAGPATTTRSSLTSGAIPILSPTASPGRRHGRASRATWRFAAASRKRQAPPSAVRQPPAAQRQPAAAVRR